MLALAGCSSSTGGNATFTPPTTTASQIAQQLKALDPCSVIPDSTASTLHLTMLGRHDLTSPVAWGCKWQAQAETVGTANVYTVLFSIYPDSDATDLNTQGQTVTQVSTNGRSGLKLDDGNGSCTLTMKITDTSSAEIIASADESRACSIATDVASIVEPKLPKG